MIPTPSFVTIPMGRRIRVSEMNGVLTTQVGGSIGSVGNSIVLQSDGKVITGGSNADKQFLIRYNPDGTLDAGFGENGVVFSNEYSFDKIVIQPDDKLLIRSYNLQGAHKLIRYNADGTRDNGFGINGAVNSGGYYIAGIALQSNGKIIIGGTLSLTLSIMERYNRNGTLDTSFGTNGRITISNTSINQYHLGTIKSIAIQRNNKILTAGSLGGIFSVHRFNSNGAIDNTFGANGLVTTQLGSICRLKDITLQPDGKIVAVGDTSLTGYTNVGLVRYLGDAPEVAPIITNFDYDGDGKADVSVFRPSNGIWYLNQSTDGFAGIQFGLSTDKLVPADYDGDGKTDIAVYRDGFWYLQQSTVGFTGLQFGIATDIPTPADYDGDGKTDVAVFRDGSWYMINSQPGFSGIQFGIASDKPISAAFVP